MPGPGRLHCHRLLVTDALVRGRAARGKARQRARDSRAALGELDTMLLRVDMASIASAHSRRGVGGGALARPIGCEEEPEVAQTLAVDLGSSTAVLDPVEGLTEGTKTRTTYSYAHKPRSPGRRERCTYQLARGSARCDRRARRATSPASVGSRRVVCMANPAGRWNSRWWAGDGLDDGQTARKLRPNIVLTDMRMRH
jgi:hypothetical protein